jgi:predicted TPR repeat methyltransferase
MTSIYSDGTYSAKNPDWHSADSQWKANQISSILKSNNLYPKSCVEVGCGAGLILENLFNENSSRAYTGYDVSGAAAKFWANRNPAISFHEGDFTASHQHFELLLLIDVFEHVEDYIGFLRRLNQRADHFVFHIPLEMHVSGVLRDRHNFARNSVGHLHYFSRSTALATLAAAGYDIVEERFTKLSQQTVEGHSGATSLANFVRRFIEMFSLKLAAKLLGGYSLLVLCTASTKRPLGEN